MRAEAPRSLAAARRATRTCPAPRERARVGASDRCAAEGRPAAAQVPAQTVGCAHAGRPGRRAVRPRWEMRRRLPAPGLLSVLEPHARALRHALLLGWCRGWTIHNGTVMIRRVRLSPRQRTACSWRQALRPPTTITVGAGVTGRCGAGARIPTAVWETGQPRQARFLYRS